MKPSILDGGYEIVLANWPNFKRIICSTHNNIPLEIPSHPYVLLNRTVLCNCIIEVESNFLLESIAACNMESYCEDCLNMKIKPAIIRTSEGNISNLARLKQVMSAGILV